ncbi:RIP metalloprotease RseP [Leuconostocaceae bacterium ESL0958]|nr:RIP metalloprotease RseP [Leuconostocaceae bacterium ESL0958]
MTAILVFLLVFGLLVGFHEFGHFIVAKKAGVLVREFAIGMGPKIFAWSSAETRYTIRLLPVGGYVRMASQTDHETLTPGQRVRLALNEAGAVDSIDVRADVDGPGFAFQIDQADLVDQLTLTGLRAGTSEMTTLPVSDQAKIIDESGQSLPIAPRSKWVESAPVWKRLAINVAGPVMNFVLAILAAAALACSLAEVHFNEAKIGQVVQEQPAARAGLKTGDTIREVDGQSVSSFTDFAAKVRAQKGQPVVVQVDRSGKHLTKTIQPEKVTENGQSRYRIGVGVAGYRSPSARVHFALTTVSDWFTQVGKGVLDLFTGGFSLNKLGGPVMMAKVTSNATQQGLVTVLALTGLLSVNLGLINLLPIPPLDGGKILIDLLEALFRRPVPERAINALTTAGGLVLLVLMVLVTAKDIFQY